MRGLGSSYKPCLFGYTVTRVLCISKSFFFKCFHPDGWHRTVGQSEPALTTTIFFNEVLSGVRYPAENQCLHPPMHTVRRLHFQLLYFFLPFLSYICPLLTIESTVLNHTQQKKKVWPLPFFFFSSIPSVQATSLTFPIFFCGFAVSKNNFSRDFLVLSFYLIWYN